MAAATDLTTLLVNLRPTLAPEELVFCTVVGATYGHGAELRPVAAVQEREGLTLVLPREQADAHGLTRGAVFRRITLGVHSDLEAVGLTAAVAGCLAERGLCANVLAGYYHDHIFVPADRAEEALAALEELARVGAGNLAGPP